MNYKKGDKAIISKTGSHGFSVGEEVEIIELIGEGEKREHYQAKNELNNRWWVIDDEL